MLKKASDAQWTVIPDTPFKHHFLLEVKGEQLGNAITSSVAEEEDYMDLSGL